MSCVSCLVEFSFYYIIGPLITLLPTVTEIHCNCNRLLFAPPACGKSPTTTPNTTTTFKTGLR